MLPHHPMGLTLLIIMSIMSMLPILTILTETVHVHDPIVTIFVEVVPEHLVELLLSHLVP